MDADLLRFAHGIAGNVWKGARLALHASFDIDDLRQEAALSAWLWVQQHPEWNADARARAVTAKVVRYDLIDYMRGRGAGSGKRDATTGEFPHKTPRSLDEPMHHPAQRFSGRGAENDTSLGDLLHDDGAQRDLERVERDHDVRRAFEQHRGNPRHSAAAWLNLNGHSLEAIGAHYGVTESRACQYRRAFIESTAERWAAAEREAEQQAA